VFKFASMIHNVYALTSWSNNATTRFCFTVAVGGGGGGGGGALGAGFTSVDTVDVGGGGGGGEDFGGGGFDTDCVGGGGGVKGL
jgi:hypothetical protein